MSTQTKSGVMNTDSGRRRTILKDNSWIRRNPEEDEPVDYDPNPGKVVLSQRKSVDDADSKPVKANQTPATSVSSLTKRFGGSQELLNKSMNPALKTPSSSSFTARVFSGANSSSKPLSPVKRMFGEKLPEVTASQTTNGLYKTSSSGAAPSTPPASVTVSPSPAPSATDTSVKSSAITTPVIQPAVKSPIRNESVSASTLVSTSSTPTPQTIITNTKTSSSMLEETPKPAEKPSVDLKLSDVSSSSTRSPSPPPAVTLNTRYNYQTPSAPLDDLADTLLPSRSGSVHSQPVRSQTQVKTVHTEVPAASPPLQTLESSRTLSSRDVCTVCGKPIGGSERMILEDLKIISHTSCFRCAVCRCDLGGLEAGKSLWVYRERVNCANCYSKIRGQWYI